MNAPESAGGKTAIKTARPSPRSGKALPLGNHPGNTGGKKGRSGRPPEPFRRFLARARRDKKFHAALLKALRDPESRGFSSALKVLAEYDTKKPGQKLDVTSGGKALPGVVILPAVEEAK